jgi:hypothetical protein
MMIMTAVAATVMVIMMQLFNEESIRVPYSTHTLLCLPEKETFRRSDSSIFGPYTPVPLVAGSLTQQTPFSFYQPEVVFKRFFILILLAVVGLRHKLTFDT